VLGRADEVVVLPGRGFLLGLAARANGELLVCDTKNHCVWSVDPATGAVDMFVDRVEGTSLAVPNWGCFTPAGDYLLSDSGGWKRADGRIIKVSGGDRQASVWSTATACFPNGMAVSEDGLSLWVLESTPGRLWAIPILPDGSAGDAELKAEIPGVPDGVAALVGGGVVISCYRPDTIYLWTPEGGLEVLLEDPEGTALAAPTNVLFTGADRSDLVWPNLGRWHASIVRDSGLRGAVVHLG